jgi:hypothetical protein
MLKRTPLKRIGKIGRRNIEANRKLKDIYQEKGITRCEICNGTFGLGFHHKNKRWFYRDKLHLLSSFYHTLLLNQKCHSILEYDRKKHDYYFNKLRMSELRKKIREAIIATGKGDPQQNFTILEERKDGSYKVEV